MNIQNERGLTLIEVLVTIVLLSLFGIILSLILNTGLSSYKSVTIQNEMRSEADVIMTTIIKQTYSKNASKLSISEDKQRITLNDYNEFIEIENGKVYIQVRDENHHLVKTLVSNENYDFSKTTFSLNSKKVLTVHLTIQSKKNKKITMNLKNELGLLN
ncbi:MAG TPA: prepilin-type N-terminal cleavage/methylation domain-containing protein [Massilibacterium sp.]|nr:prepilin-type N-terminal cleavage/methylation domain-containing protein [Massilibacterium sp.]